MVQRVSAEQVIESAVRLRDRRSSGKSLVAAVITLLALIGLGLLLIFAIGAGHPDDNSAPTCDGQAMTSDDVCDVWTNGNLSTYSYQDEMDRQHNGSPGLRIAGMVLIGFTLVIAIPVLRTNRPGNPWGKPVDASCPRCGRPTLREKYSSVSRSQGRVRYTTSGIVTLCTADCAHREIRPSGTARR